MLKIQPDNDHFRLNITTDKKYVLRPEKNGFVVQNPPFHIVCKIAFYIFLIIKNKLFRVKRYKAIIKQTEMTGWDCVLQFFI